MKLKKTILLIVSVVFLLGCIRSYAQVLTPNFSVVNAGDTLSYCAPHLINFQNLSKLTDSAGKPITSDSIVSLTWMPGDGNSITKSATNKTLAFNYLTNNTYDVSLTVQTAKGLKATITKKGYVKIIGPTVSFKIISDSFGFAPLKVSFQVNFDKNFRNGVFNFIDCRDSNGCVPPVSIITGNNNTLTFSYSLPGTYHPFITVTDTFRDGAGHPLPPCSLDWPPSNLSAGVQVPTILVKQGATGIENFKLKDFTKSYINASGRLQIHLSQNFGQVNIQLFDVAGRSVGSAIIPTGENDFSMDLASIHSGILLVRMQSANEVYTTRLFKN